MTMKKTIRKGSSPLTIPLCAEEKTKSLYFAICRDGCGDGRPCGLLSPARPPPPLAETVFIALPVEVTAIRTFPPPFTDALRVVAIFVSLFPFPFPFGFHGLRLHVVVIVRVPVQRQSRHVVRAECAHSVRAAVLERAHTHAGRL